MECVRYPKSLKEWLKKRFFYFLKITFTFSRIKSATKFLCVKTFSGTVVFVAIPLFGWRLDVVVCVVGRVNEVNQHRARLVRDG